MFHFRRKGQYFHILYSALQNGNVFNKEQTTKLYLGLGLSIGIIDQALPPNLT